MVHVSHTLQVMPEKMDIIKEQCDKRTWYAIKQKRYHDTTTGSSFDQVCLCACAVILQPEHVFPTRHTQSLSTLN